jgi:hypothetical protein
MKLSRWILAPLSLITSLALANGPSTSNPVLDWNNEVLNATRL